MNKPKHIAIFGGSFDPPHLGHHALVASALAQLDVDELWLIPVGVPVHKELSGKATATQRLAWLTTMFAHDSRVNIVDWEVKSSAATPAIATLRRFQQQYPQRTPTWLLGMDSWHDLPNWVDYPEHQKLCNLAVFSRKGVKTMVKHDVWQPIQGKTMPQDAGHIMLLDVDLPDISASQIRANPSQYQDQLPQSTCNAILACYASPIDSQKREDK